MHASQWVALQLKQWFSTRGYVASPAPQGDVWQSLETFFLKEHESLLFLNPYPRTCPLISEKGTGREKERERNIDVREKHWLVAFCKHPDQGQTHNLGTCPDWESNLRPFGLQGDAPPIEPHQPGISPSIFTNCGNTHNIQCTIFKLTVQWHSVHSHCCAPITTPVSYTHLTLPTKGSKCRSRWSPYH